MSYVAINVLTVPEGAGSTLEERFAARQGAVDSAPGFEHFELLRPLEGTYGLPRLHALAHARPTSPPGGSRSRSGRATPRPAAVPRARGPPPAAPRSGRSRWPRPPTGQGPRHDGAARGHRGRPDDRPGRQQGPARASAPQEQGTRRRRTRTASPASPEAVPGRKASSALTVASGFSTAGECTAPARRRTPRRAARPSRPARRGPRVVGLAVHHQQRQAGRRAARRPGRARRAGSSAMASRPVAGREEAGAQELTDVALAPRRRVVRPRAPRRPRRPRSAALLGSGRRNGSTSARGPVRPPGPEPSSTSERKAAGSVRTAPRGDQPAEAVADAGAPGRAQPRAASRRSAPRASTV